VAAVAAVTEPRINPDLPGLVALRRADAQIQGWPWCQEHGWPRYDGANPCDRLHQIAAGDRVCGLHLRAHGPYEFGRLCAAWGDVARAELERRPRRRWLRWLSR
jgi:hypothetical protein